MIVLRRLFSTRGSSALRAVVRVAVLCVAAFGTELDVNQIAAIQLATEALLQLGVALIEDPPEP